MFRSGDYVSTTALRKRQLIGADRQRQCRHRRFHPDASPFRNRSPNQSSTAASGGGEHAVSRSIHDRHRHAFSTRQQLRSGWKIDHWPLVSLFARDDALYLVLAGTAMVSYTSAGAFPQHQAPVRDDQVEPGYKARPRAAASRGTRLDAGR
jgi:hypothetical protein